MEFGDGAAFGAVYRPPPVICPHATPAQPGPDRLQLTIWFVVPVTVAVNCCWAPGLRATEVGETVTTTAADADDTRHNDVPRTLRMTKSFPLQLMTLPI